MPLTEDIIKKIADDTGISVGELTISGLLAFLREKRRKIMMDRLEVLNRYNVTSGEEIENKIKFGEIPEHPTWEDLILLENLESAIAQINEDIRAIQESS
jgi:type I restriction-modification system DNA methylase subunit